MKDHTQRQGHCQGRPPEFQHSLKFGSIPARQRWKGEASPASNPCPQSPDISHGVGCETAGASLWFVERNELPLQGGLGSNLITLLS